MGQQSLNIIDYLKCKQVLEFLLSIGKLTKEECDKIDALNAKVLNIAIV